MIEDENNTFHQFAMRSSQRTARIRFRGLAVAASLRLSDHASDGGRGHALWSSS